MGETEAVSKEQSRFLEDVITPIFAAVGLLVTLYSVRPSLPDWLFTVLAIILLAIVVVLTPVAIVLGMRFGWSLALKDLRTSYRANRDAKKLFPEFLRFVQRLHYQTELNKIDSISHILNQLQYPNEGRLSFPDTWYPWFLSWRLSEMKWAKKNLEALVWTVDIFGGILRLFTELYVNPAIDEVLRLGFSRVQGNLRHGLTVARDRYVRLLDDWDEFVDKANTSFPSDKKSSLPALRKVTPARPKVLA